MLLLVLVLSFATATIQLACSPPPAKFMTVRTTNGAITGHIAANTSCVVEYLGIPYAKPPVGDLRFAPPERITTSKPHTAASFGYDCPLTPSKPVDYPGFTAQAQRIINYFASAAGTPQSEDCLTLNIWSRPTARSEARKKPVLVFFYGGRFTIGNTNTPMYTASRLAQSQDMIVITVTYRLSIFGFPGSSLPSAQNLGLRDQRAALEWIRTNIPSFGGDPSKITISGQSSGGVGVDYWAYSYTKDPIARGLIAASGTAFSFPQNSVEVQQRNWKTVVAAVACANATDEMSCMRGVDWKDIKAAAAAIKPAKSTSVLRAIPPFWPTPDGEIVYSSEEYVSLTQAGKFVKLPMLLGNTDGEYGYYQIPIYANGVVPTQKQRDDFLLESFTCPVSYQAAARRKAGVPTWVFRYFGDWDNTRLYPTSGAYHGVDLHMIFGMSEEASGLPASKEQKELTAWMQKAWFSFVDDPVNGLSGVGWPVFDKDKKTLVQLGLGNVPEVKLAYPSGFDAPCSTVTMGALGTAAPV